MGDWELSQAQAAKLLVNAFPDLFKETNSTDTLLVSNGIEALNITAYGGAAILDTETHQITRVGEPALLRATVEKMGEEDWISLSHVTTVDPLLKAGVVDILDKTDVPMIFTSEPVISGPFYPEVINRIVSQKEELQQHRFVVIWGQYVGESFWEYFSSLVLRRVGFIAGYFGTTGADVHAYYIPEFSDRKFGEYSWSIFMFYIAPLLRNRVWITYDRDPPDALKQFISSLQAALNDKPLAVVVEAETTAYRTRSHSEKSGIGQAMKYIKYGNGYSIGFSAGPGADEQSLSYNGGKVREVGIISCDESAQPVLVPPKMVKDGFVPRASERLISTVKEYIYTVLENAKQEYALLELRQ